MPQRHVKENDSEAAVDGLPGRDGASLSPSPLVQIKKIRDLHNRDIAESPDAQKILIAGDT